MISSRSAEKQFFTIKPYQELQLKNKYLIRVFHKKNPTST